MGKMKKGLPSIASIGNHFLKTSLEASNLESSETDSIDKPSSIIQPLVKVIPPTVSNQNYNDYYKCLKIKRWLYEKDAGIGSAKLTSVNYLNYLYSHQLIKPIEPKMMENILFEQSKCSFSSSQTF